MGWIMKLRSLHRKSAIRLGAILAIVAIVAGTTWAVAVARGSSQTLLDVTLAQLEEDVQKDPQDVQKRLAVAIAYSARGYNGAAIDQFQEVLRLEENNQTALMGLGRSYMDQGDTEKALEPLLKVAELNKDNPFRRTIEQLEAVYYDLGMIYLEQKEPATAAEYLLQALEINSADADAWHQLGRAQQAAGQFDAALSSYEQAVRFVPDYADVYRRMARIYAELGRTAEHRYATGMVELSERAFDRALTDLEEAAKQKPDLAEAHQGLGMVLESKGKSREALLSYQKALELDPDLLLSKLAVQRLGGA